MQAERTCSSTGLRLLPAGGRVAYRVAKPSYGPLNPVLRNGGDVDTWGRYDVADHRTIYASDCRRAALFEVLAPLAPSLGLQSTLLSDCFVDFPPSDPRALLDAIVCEYDQLFQESPLVLVSGWREARSIYRLTLPEDGWLVDVEHEQSLSALNHHLRLKMPTFEVSRLTRGALAGENRPITTAVSRWVWNQTLDDGTRPHGLYYPSKHGRDWGCFAIWLRELDASPAGGSEQTKAVAEEEIRPVTEDPDLAAVQEPLRLRIL